MQQSIINHQQFNDLVAPEMDYINNQANELVNSVYTQQDAVQDILAKLWKYFNTERRFYRHTESERRKILRSVVCNFVVDKIRYFARRKDYSKYRPTVDESTPMVSFEALLQGSESFDGVVDESDESQLSAVGGGYQFNPSQGTFVLNMDVNYESYQLLLCIRQEVEQAEQDLPGIVEYFDARVAPTEEFYKKLESINQSSGRRYSSNSDRVPDGKLAQVLRIPRNRITVYQARLSKILSQYEEFSLLLRPAVA